MNLWEDFVVGVLNISTAKKGRKYIYNICPIYYITNFDHFYNAIDCQCLKKIQVRLVN